MRSPICESKDSELGRAPLGHWGQMRQSERSLGASAASALGLLRTSNIAAISWHRWQLTGPVKTAPLALIVTFEKPDREEQVGKACYDAKVALMQTSRGCRS